MVAIQVIEIPDEELRWCRGVHHQPSLCDASWERQEKIGEGR